MQLDAFLVSDEVINWEHPQVFQKAQQLANGLDNKLDIARRCFEFVRDEIKHSRDYQLNPVTCKASDVLHHASGYCYAKSHLLAALLRANRIAAGLCYQRLTIDNDRPPFCLHGLNAVYLDDYGWYRIDARGNKPGVQAEFTPPQEKLAFALLSAGEKDINGIFHRPLQQVIDVLESCDTYQQVAENLPDYQGA